MVSGAQKEELLKKIKFKDEDKWLYSIYVSKIEEVLINESFVSKTMMDEEVRK